MIELGITALLLMVGYLVGGAREKSHFKDLIRRERFLLDKVMVRSDRGPKMTSGDTFMVVASVVIASDYFKNFIGNLKNFFGGRLTSHESLLDRARREALCRIREKAHQQGASEIVNVRYETSFIDSLGIEVSAYGTAIKNE
jgi:uncharacterized protein YbjQ (UPF0145 family)